MKIAVAQLKSLKGNIAQNKEKHLRLGAIQIVAMPPIGS